MNTENANAVVLVERFYEDMELWYPLFRLKEEKASVSIVGPEKGVTYNSKHGYPATSDEAADDVDVQQLDAVIIPGGYAPDHMRRTPGMVELVRNAWEQGSVVAFICHGGWIAVSADILHDKRATSFYAIRDDMVNAGANWVDAEVVQDGNLVSARKPDDLPAFSRTILELLREK